MSKLAAVAINNKMRWKHLLNASRCTAPNDANKRRSWKVFALKQDNFKPFPEQPSDFHQTLCREIRGAKERVLLASLYIGPAADNEKYVKETELLASLESVQPNVEIKILMDENRGLRPIPVTGSNDTISAAEACRRALTRSAATKQGSMSKNVYLINVLSDMWQKILPNPYNEAAGVFHIKAYIIDNQLLLSGANLSEEYFTDRHDRYLWLENCSLVDCYADLVRTLCKHASEYSIGNVSAPMDRDKLLEDVMDVLTEEVSSSDTEEYDDREDIVAFAIPTFQSPFKHSQFSHSYPTDTQTVHSLCSETAKIPHNSIRVSSAYLNPTQQLLQAWKNANVHMMTAGKVSHGFKPKPKAGNKGKTWIPAAFDLYSREAVSERCKLWFYQRNGWTFHSKGLWIGTGSTDTPQFEDDATLLAVSHGSGNFGWRSELRDMESNLFLFFPRQSSISKYHVQEWNEMCKYAVSDAEEPKDELSFPLSYILPTSKGRSFF